MRPRLADIGAGGLVGSGLAYPADPVGIPVYQQVQVTATAFRKNRTTGTCATKITLTNCSPPKQTVYEPLTLVVTRFGRPDVSLANAIE